MVKKIKEQRIRHAMKEKEEFYTFIYNKHTELNNEHTRFITEWMIKINKTSDSFHC